MTGWGLPISRNPYDSADLKRYRRVRIPLGPLSQRIRPISNRNSSGLFAGKWLRAPATMHDEGLADVAAPNPVALPRLHPGIGSPPVWPSTKHGLFDHLIRPLQERRRDRQAEGLRGLEVDDQLELRGLFDGQVAGLGALQNLVDVGGCTTK